MTDKEALQIVLEAATKHWAQDTRDARLKVALLCIETIEKVWPARSSVKTPVVMHAVRLHAGALRRNESEAQ
jgi:hypothetical protein